MTLETLAKQGRPQLSANLAQTIGTRIRELRKDSIKESFADFMTEQHRMETVSKVHGIEFVNDSVSCTVNATWYALESTNKPVIWLAGGLDRNSDYSILHPLVKEKVKAIICLGRDNRRISEAFDDIDIAVVRAEDMQEAVELAYHLGRTGDVVLLSPCCPSFDKFENYEERGNKFRKMVREL
jgi:UDP-N-acetylmuramoylalanine--D-glutamate ligase